MGKAERNKRQTAQQKIAAQRAAAKRAERQRTLMLSIGSVVAVLAVVAALIVIKVVSDSNKGPASLSKILPLQASVAHDLASVPATTLAKVGTGSVLTYLQSHGAKAFSPGKGAPLVSGGKPEMLYIGAEFCPYCAATRWAMAIALNKFGTFNTSTVHEIRSGDIDPDGAHEPDPDTATLSYDKTQYTSKYLTFVPVEQETREQTPLETVSKAQQAIWNTYEPPGANGTQGYPFIDFGNKYAIEGPLYDPGDLGGLSKNWSQVAASLSNASSPIAQGADGEANMITAAICGMIGNKAPVCSASYLKSLEGQLTSG